MKQELPSGFSNNSLRRMQTWAAQTFPKDGEDRSAVVAEYLAQLDEDALAALIKKGWPEVFAAAERDWPEAFAGWKQEAPADES